MNVSPYRPRICVTRAVRYSIVAAALSLALCGTNAHAACAFKIDTAAATGATAMVDGLLLVRYVRGMRGGALTAGISTTLSETSVRDHIAQRLSSIDLNGDGAFDENDAIMISRHLVGLRGAGLQPVASTNPSLARATGDAAQAFIDLGCPAGLQVAALGAPRLAPVNGLATVLDERHRIATHALPANFVTPTAPNAAPMIAPIRVLGRRDSAIFYLPNVAGAADYRAYVEGRPVIACAGYRQRGNVAREDAPGGNVVRELLHALELPGLTQTGNYRVVIEALDRPCPFTGMPAHTSVTIATGATATGGSVPYTGFNDSIARYGAEIINGQGSTSDWFLQTGQRRGQAVPSGNAAATPNVIARSTIQVTLPFADEAVNAPIIDVGSNAIFDDFKDDAMANFSLIPNRSFGGSDAIVGPFGPWYFFGVSAQAAVGQTAPLGVQVWRRHGRLNVTLADWAQNVFSAVHFTSTQTKPLVIENQRYAHSFFRIDSGATGRRYWHWMMCGANTRDELVNPTTNIPRVLPVLQPDFFSPGGTNPTEPAFGETLTPYHRRECLNILQLLALGVGGPGGNAPDPDQSLAVTINPVDRSNGVINLAPSVFDRGFGELGFYWRVNAAGQYIGPLIEPFDQQQPLTHYDIFARKDRIVVFVNGRQGLCVDLSARPLAMNYGLIAYGQVLYHSSAEMNEYYLPERPADKPYQRPYGSFHLTMNTPAADSRAWDAVGHAEGLEIPAIFNFDASLCRAPATVAVR